MKISNSLTNHFLIAMPALVDPNFFQTVTYICEHNAQGALGIIINRPLNIVIGELLEHMGIEVKGKDLARLPVYMGGPVQRERGFVLHDLPGEWEATLKVSNKIAVTTSRDILTTIARGEGPEHVLVALGYAGWGAGQLEREIMENAWLSGPADSEILFEIPDQDRWQAAAALLGVDINLLSSDVGHA
jgi:Putative transcriptional regulator